MELGMIGLGRMGAAMTKRLIGAGHSVVVYDRDQAAIARSAADGAIAAESLEAMVSKLKSPCAVTCWPGWTWSSSPCQPTLRHG